MRRPSLGALLAAGSAVAYGSLAVLARLAYDEGWNTPSLLTARFGAAALALLPLALRASGGWSGFGRGLLVGALGFAGTTALYFPSLRLLPAAVASFLLYLAPVLVALLAWPILRERPRRRDVAALGGAVAGLAVLASGGLTGRLSLAGIALAAGSALTYAGTVVASRGLVPRLAWPRATLAVCTGALASYVAFGLAHGALAVPASLPGLAYAAAIGVVATALAMGLFFAALPRLGASRTALVLTLEPVSTLVLAAVVLAELPSWTSIGGGLLILAAAAVVAQETREPAAPAAGP